MKATEAILAGVFAGGGSGGGGGGMTLYGPYYAGNEGGEVLPITENAYVDMTMMTDYAGNAVTFPSDMGAAVVMNSFSVNVRSVHILEISAPGDDTETYSPGSIVVQNSSGSDITLDPNEIYFSFFSSKPFPVADGD